jgi:uncharacterized protein YlbG (UPF0298 family)
MVSRYVDYQLLSILHEMTILILVWFRCRSSSRLTVELFVYLFQTTCAQALKNWETVNGVSAEEADYVKLYCQVPPINKLDSSLNSLRNCERLALSTNTIDRMISLAGMSRLKILSLGRNQIKKVNIFGSFALILCDSVSWGDRSRS